MRSLAVFDHNCSGYLELCKDDEADIFFDDDCAWDVWIGRLKKIQARCTNATDRSAIQMATELLNNWREPMASVMRGNKPSPPEDYGST